MQILRALWAVYNAEGYKVITAYITENGNPSQAKLWGFTFEFRRIYPKEIRFYFYKWILIVRKKK